jgi:hypothetical protein
MKEPMKRFKITAIVLMIMVAGISNAFAQKIDNARMERDIEVAENVLSTLIKQQLDQRMFFPMEITGTYQPGYGVTFRLPADYTTPIALAIPRGQSAYVWDSERQSGYTYTIGGETPQPDDVEPAIAPNAPMKLKDKAREKEKTQRRYDMDSLKASYNKRVIDAATNFIVDYGDMISQLAPGEKIIITNGGDRNRIFGQYLNSTKRTHIVVEGLKSDVTAFKQGKLTREQTVTKIKIINAESSDRVEPDMELLSSIFSRLYRSDLSKTFFSDENIYYERLTDFGAVFYMAAYSSVPAEYPKFHMPTLGLESVDAATREKKVKEIYPVFENELKENIIEYGRTLKSLKDEESLIFNVTLTKCVNCGIPSTLEVSVKSSVLKDFNAGKIDKATALSKVVTKKGANQ